VAFGGFCTWQWEFAVHNAAALAQVAVHHRGVFNQTVDVRQYNAAARDACYVK